MEAGGQVVLEEQEVPCVLWRWLQISWLEIGLWAQLACVRLSEPSLTGCVVLGEWL